MQEFDPANERAGISGETVLASLEAVLRSKTFANSQSLRQLLEFVVRKGFSSPLEPIKEYTLATEVLGRSHDFDPRGDNIVRVQMGRLRDKLAEYYLAEGQKDQIRIVMPRGKYVAEFIKAVEEVAATHPAASEPSARGPLTKGRIKWRWVAGFSLVVLILVLGVSLLRLAGRHTSPFASLWRPFLLPDSVPLVVYSNTAFFVSKEGDYFHYDSPTVLSMAMGRKVQSLDDQEVQPGGKGVSGPFYYFDAFTGSGEVVAAARISQFLTARGEPFLIKRSRIISYGDIAGNNVIFLGSPKENQLLQKLPIKQELVFDPPPPDRYPIGSSIRDLNPPSGHQATYEMQLDPVTGAINAEYGLISLLPGVAGDHYVLVLGGLTTLGTEGAAEFVTSDRRMAALQRMLEAVALTKNHPLFFQALIKVEVRDGVPLDVTCLFVRGLSDVGR